jgi:hypothetical protein
VIIVPPLHPLANLPAGENTAADFADAPAYKATLPAPGSRRQMDQDIPTLLAAIAEEQAQAGESIAGPAPDQAIAAIDRYVRDRFAMPLPPELARLWALRDGVDFNGMTIYRATTAPLVPYRASLMEVNEAFGAVTGTRYLFIGEADGDAFVHDRQTGAWHIADRISLDSSASFNSCGGLLRATLAKYLDA